MELADLDVLIVDDHEAMRTLLARVLAKAGVERVRTAASGEEALAALRQQPASLILTDRNMPGMDGIAFIEAVRSEAALARAKIVVISGNAGEAEGADAVLTKPVSPRDLLAAVEALLAV